MPRGEGILASCALYFFQAILQIQRGQFTTGTAQPVLTVTVIYSCPLYPLETAISVHLGKDRSGPAPQSHSPVILPSQVTLLSTTGFKGFINLKHCIIKSRTSYDKDISTYGPNLPQLTPSSSGKHSYMSLGLGLLKFYLILHKSKKRFSFLITIAMYMSHAS